MHLYEGLLLLTAIAVFALIYKLAKRQHARHGAGGPTRDGPFSLEVDTPAASDSTPPSSPGGLPAARPTTTARERRALEIATRAESGACLYCEREAMRAIPQLTQPRSLLDPLHRRLNVPPIQRWVINLTPDVSVPLLVCEVHQATARGHFDKKLAENTVARAAFDEAQREEMYDFIEYGLDERMNEDVQRAKKKQINGPRLTAVPRANTG